MRRDNTKMQMPSSTHTQRGCQERNLTDLLKKVKYSNGQSTTVLLLQKCAAVPGGTC